MATPVESTTSAAKDPRGFSGLDESQLEKSILRRGLATPAELEACKNQRKQLAAKQKEDPPKSLLEIMVEAKVLTRSQMVRLLQEGGARPARRSRSPATPSSRSSAKARWGSFSRPSR